MQLIYLYNNNNQLMDCPSDIITEICSHVSTHELIRMRTLCKTTYNYMLNTFKAVNDITIYHEESDICVNNFYLETSNINIRFPLLHFRALKNFKNVTSISVNVKSKRKLNKIIHYVYKDIKEIHISGSINYFKWKKLLRFENLTHLYVDISLFLKEEKVCESDSSSDDGIRQTMISSYTSPEAQILNKLKSSKLYYLHIWNYDYDWSGVDFIWVVKMNIPVDQIDYMKKYIKDGHKNREFCARYV